MSKMMKSGMIKGSLATVATTFMAGVMTACAPGASGPAVDGANQSLGANCAGPQKILASSELASLALKGQAQAATNEMVMMSINQDVGCMESGAVTWKLSSGQVISTEGGRLVARFSQPGTYRVEAKVNASADLGQGKIGSETLTLAQATTVLDNVPAIQGPQVAMIGTDVTFAILTPTGMDVDLISWNFGDGAKAEGSIATHMYELTGKYAVKANVRLKNGASYDLEQSMQILDYYDDFDCVTEAQIFASQIGEVNVPVDLNVNVPACLRSSISAVRWTFGDASNQLPGLSVQHSYAATGVYDVKADIYSPLAEDGILFTLTHKIRINEAKVEEPAPKCTVLGERRTTYTSEATKEESCGVDGKKQVTRHQEIVEECQYNDLVQDWALISTQEVVKSETACSGQSCDLPGGGKLANGQNQLLYSTTRPEGSCSEVSQNRTCENGKLSGSATHAQLTCMSGCVGFGQHETIKKNVVVGEVKMPLTCQFGEQGFFDVFQKVEDRQCVNGQVKSSETRSGDIKVKGQCPVYKYAPTSEWSECSAACGGQQQQVHACVDGEGSPVDGVRCTGAAPVVTRVCDGNPESVRRQEVATVKEEANSSNSCPKNQIGIVLKSRDITTTKTYACIDHAVKTASEKVVASAWVEEKYCREYVAHRCSNDSLTNKEATARYQWMLKCQNSVPAIKEFLAKFDDVGASQKASISGERSRLLYPTFMNAGVKPERTWVAPKTANASCTVPEKIYVAAVCLASCATPEQAILTEIKGQKAYGSQTFIEALQQKTKHVVTLSETSSLQNLSYQKTAVSNWVTELVDTEHEILDFKMRSGGSLRVTPNHPLLTADGVMHEARDLKAGDALLKMGGVKDVIVSVRTTSHYGKVYNLFTASSAPEHNIVITNGYLNGSAFYQNEAANMMNRQVLRSRLIKGAFSK